MRECGSASLSAFLLMIREGSSNYFPLYDGRGNVTGLADSSGYLVAACRRLRLLGTATGTEVSAQPRFAGRRRIQPQAGPLHKPRPDPSPFRMAELRRDR